MAAGTKIQHKRKASAFVGGELAAGEFGIDTVSGTVYVSRDGATVASLGAGGATNLSIANITATTLDVASDTGTDATIPAATGSAAGVATAAQITKLNAITGTNTGDQTITLTGDVTGSGTGSFVATIASGVVTLAKQANLAQDQFIGRVTPSTGVPETATITAAARTVLDDTTVSAMVNTIGGATATGTGGLVRATSPTLVTPALGTPSSGNLANCTFPTLNQNTTGSADSIRSATTTVNVAAATAPTVGQALIATSSTAATWQTLTGGGNAQTANPLSQFAATTSAQLAGVMSDETGNGALVFATSPTLVTPVLGTPASGNLANCTFPTLNQNTTGYAEALKSATTTVSVSASAAPNIGDVITATSSTTATWQAPAGGGSAADFIANQVFA